MLDQRNASQTELNALRKKIWAHWNLDKSSVSQPDHDVAVVRFHLDRDGRLSAAPKVVSTGTALHDQAAAGAAKRAIVLSQPFDVFSPSNYAGWKDVQVNFYPRRTFSDTRSAPRN